MEGIEKITGRILSDAKAEANSILAAGKEETDRLSAEYRRRADEIREKARASAQIECDAMLSRVESSSGNVRRNMILEEKNRLLDAAFAEASSALPAAEGYSGFLCSLAVRAVTDNAAREAAAGEEDEDFVPAEDYELLLAEADMKYASEIEAAVASVSARAGKRVVVTPDRSIKNGFVLRCGSVSTDCTVAALISEYRPEIEAGAAALLFEDRK